MRMWQGLLVTVGVIVLALLIYDKWVKGRI